MRKKVLMLLTNPFRPDRRVAKEAELLVRNGYDVTVLAWDRENNYPERSVYRGMNVERLRIGQAESVRSMVLFYPLFFLLSLLRGLRREVDIVHSHDFDTLVLGHFIAWFKRVPLVFDAHENYAQMISVDVPGWMARAVELLEGRFTRKAAVVITVSEAHAAHMRKYAQNGVILVENCAPLPEGVSPPRFEGRELVLNYIGTLEPQRYIIESIDLCKGLDGIVYDLAGWGRLEGQVRERADGKKVRFLGRLHEPALFEVMAASDVIVCLLDPSNRNYVGNSPTKIYDAMAVGVPVLTTKGTTSGELVDKVGCGLAIEWSEGGFRRALERFRDPRQRQEWGDAGRAAAEREYNWEAMGSRLLEAYRKALS